MHRTLRHVALALGLSALPVSADPILLAGARPLAETTDAFIAAVEAAGARVFLTEDFQAGAKRAGLDLRPTRIVYFGGPKIGAGALMSAQTLAMELPLHVLIYEDADGRVWMTHDDPADLAVRHGVDPADPGIRRMSAAFAELTALAAGES